MLFLIPIIYGLGALVWGGVIAGLVWCLATAGLITAPGWAFLQYVVIGLVVTIVVGVLRSIFSSSSD